MRLIPIPTALALFVTLSTGISNAQDSTTSAARFFEGVPYHIVREDVFRCLEIGGDENGKLNDARVTQSDCNGTGHQQWSVQTVGGDSDYSWYRIVSEHSGRCLSNKGLTGKASVVASDCKIDPSQMWRVEGTDKNKPVQFVSKNGMCLEVVADGNTIGSLLQQNTCSSFGKQKFAMIRKRETNRTLSPMKSVSLWNPGTKNCLSLESSPEEVLPPLADAEPTISPGSPTPTPEPTPAPALEFSNGTKARTGECNTLAQWRFLPVGEGGWFYIRNLVSDRCLQNMGNGSAAQQTCTTTDNQLWRLQVKENAMNQVISKLSSLCVTTNASADSLSLAACDGTTTPNQIWEIGSPEARGVIYTAEVSPDQPMEALEP